MNPDPANQLTKNWVLFKPGELPLTLSMAALMGTVVFTHFVMGWILALLTAPLALALLLLGIIRARDSSAPAGRQWAGIGLLLLGAVALFVVAYMAASLSGKLALHAQRPEFAARYFGPVPGVREWTLNMGSWLIPVLLIGPGLTLWTNWSPVRRLVWCVVILAIPPAVLWVHQNLAALGGPLTA